VQSVKAGDELRTGPGGTVMLEVPDGSYMVVSENTTLTINNYWSGNFRSLIDLMMGKVRFHIQRLGGRPNPYRVTTPTALIAVRGTTFEVTVNGAQIAEVRCLEGQVAVQTVGLSAREVILNPGSKTLVRPGEYPLPPISNVAVFARDNDRRNRTADPLHDLPGVQRTTLNATSQH